MKCHGLFHIVTARTLPPLIFVYTVIAAGCFIQQTILNNQVMVILQRCAANGAMWKWAIFAAFVGFLRNFLSLWHFIPHCSQNRHFVNYCDSCGDNHDTHATSQFDHLEEMCVSHCSAYKVPCGMQPYCSCCLVSILDTWHVMS